LAVGAAAAAIVVIGGIGIMERAGAPAPDAATETVATISGNDAVATTVAVGEGAESAPVTTRLIERGSLSADPLSFVEVSGGPEADYLYASSCHDGVTYAVAGTRVSLRMTVSQLWKTTDGVNWSAIDGFVTGDSAHITSSAVADDGIIVAGLRLSGEEVSVYGMPSGDTVVWTSDDEITWTEAVISTKRDSVVAIST
jgi:hypothetical protein